MAERVPVRFKSSRPYAWLAQRYGSYAVQSLEQQADGSWAGVVRVPKEES